jgi:hypothetical protein
MRALKRGRPIPRSALTGVVPADYASRVRLRFRTEDAATVDVVSGERVTLLFAPTGEGAAQVATAVDAVLIDAEDDGDTTEYFVAIPPAQRDALLALVGRSRLLVTAGGL